MKKTVKNAMVLVLSLVGSVGGADSLLAINAMATERVIKRKVVHCVMVQAKFLILDNFILGIILILFINIYVVFNASKTITKTFLFL